MRAAGKPFLAQHVHRHPMPWLPFDKTNCGPIHDEKYRLYHDVTA
jgi:hypothetical protein